MALHAENGSKQKIVEAVRLKRFTTSCERRKRPWYK